jgi:hypothetical protein
VREWQVGRHEALIKEETFEVAWAAIEGRMIATWIGRRNATVYNLTGLLRYVHCHERMRMVRTERGRVRYHCRRKPQGLGCPDQGSFLDADEDQVLAVLAAFALRVNCDS